MSDNFFVSNDLKRLGFKDTGVNVTVNHSASMWLPIPHERDALPWEENPPSDLVLNAVDVAKRGVMFNEFLRIKERASSLLNFSPTFILGTSGRMPFDDDVDMPTTDAPVRTQLPSWVFEGMTFSLRVFSNKKYFKLLAIPIPYVSEEVVTGTLLSRVLLVFCCLSGGNLKKVDFFTAH